MAYDDDNSQPDYHNLAASLVHLTCSGALIQAACLAAELGIADHLAAGARSVDDLARATQSHPPSLLRLMRALVSLGLCSENSDGSFALAPMGQLLRRDRPDSLRSWMLWYGGYVWPVWAHLRHSIKTGESARGLVTDVAGFGSLARNPAAAALFDGAMSELSLMIAREVIRAYDFSDAGLIVDVGGGHGTTLAALLEAFPQPRGLVFDLPHLADGAKATLAKAKLNGRCEFQPGDFFQSIPGGGDTYVLKNVLHDWTDNECVAILRNLHKVVSTRAKVLVIERVMPAKIAEVSRHQDMAYADLTMLIGPGGRERTEAEFGALLEAGGFSLRRVVDTPLVFSVVEAVAK